MAVSPKSNTPAPAIATGTIPEKDAGADSVQPSGQEVKAASPDSADSFPAQTSPRRLRTFNGRRMPDPFSLVQYGEEPMIEVPNGWVDAQLAAGKLVVVD